MAEEERRRAERSPAVVLVQLDQEGRHGVTRDASKQGLLIATRYQFKVGDRLEVTVHAKTGAVKSNAKVVRVEETPPSEPWRYRLALELEEELPANVIQEGTKAAAILLGRASEPPARI
jgi:hypothetical protein